MSRRDLLLEILSFARPHDSECEKRFVREFVDKAHPDITQDAFGNRMVRLGSAPIMWSCHVDTVAAEGGYQMVDFDPMTGLASLRNGKGGMSLGADDGAGVWIMLQMLKAGVEGLYVFHRGEERGCLGSEWIVRNTPELLHGIDAAIAFDRGGTHDVITHQSFGMTASDKFAWSIANQLNRHKGLRFQPDNTGVFTDTNTYADLISECSNLSVGYDRNHGPNETLDVYHAERLLDAMLVLDLDAIEIDRQPGEGGWRSYMGASAGGGRHTEFDDLVQAVIDLPEAAAELLASYGITCDDVWDFAVDNPNDPVAVELDAAYERAWNNDRCPFDDDDPAFGGASGDVLGSGLSAELRVPGGAGRDAQ